MLHIERALTTSEVADNLLRLRSRVAPEIKKRFLPDDPNYRPHRSRFFRNVSLGLALLVATTGGLRFEASIIQNISPKDALKPVLTFTSNIGSLSLHTIIRETIPDRVSVRFS